MGIPRSTFYYRQKSEAKAKKLESDFEEQCQKVVDGISLKRKSLGALRLVT